MPYLTWKTYEGQNNHPGRKILCDGCGELCWSVIAIETKTLPAKVIRLCLECLDQVNNVVNWNLKLPNNLKVD